jgi:hypothetical protein
LPRRRGALDCPPAVVTKNVQSLGRRLGTRLLNRYTRHVGLTEAGALYWEHCRHVLAQREHAEAEVGALGRLPRGRLRVSALTITVPPRSSRRCSPLPQPPRPGHLARPGAEPSRPLDARWIAECDGTRGRDPLADGAAARRTYVSARRWVLAPG